jgi:predicted nucleotidyltransferase
MPDATMAPVREVARALVGLLERIVFIGGAIAPLLQVDRPFRAPRPTGDVDAIAATTSYSDFGEFSEALAARGFRQGTNSRHLHRWIAPGPLRVPFDLVPVGEHTGASGNPWEMAAVESAVETELEPGLSIWHASAPAFLALKFAAFRDRGLDDPLLSTDLEDIMALIASRPEIAMEVFAAPEPVRGSWPSMRGLCSVWTFSRICSPVTWQM